MSYTPYTGPEVEKGQVDDPPQRRSYLSMILVAAVVAMVPLLILLLLTTRGQMIVEGPGFNATAVPSGNLPTVAAPRPAPTLGSPAPDFELVDLNTGQPLTLSSLKGKPVWINFWATWCPPCKEEMPIMERHYQENRDKGLVILGVDVQEKESDVLPYIKAGGYSWTFVIDETGKIADTYHVSGLPSHYFIDKDGLIQAIVIGGLKSEMTGEIRDIAPYLQKIMP